MNRKRKSARTPSHQPFESRRNSGKFAKVCDDMMLSPAWACLNMSQRGLYLHLKGKFTKYSDGTDNRNDISIPKSEAQALYSELRTFRKDMDALIAVGLIRCIACGYTTRKPSIYGFSDRWQAYGTPGFEVPPEDRRPKVRPLRSSGSG